MYIKGSVNHLVGYVFSLRTKHFALIRKLLYKSHFTKMKRGYVFAFLWHFQIILHIFELWTRCVPGLMRWTWLGKCWKSSWPWTAVFQLLWMWLRLHHKVRSGQQALGTALCIGGRLRVQTVLLQQKLPVFSWHATDFCWLTKRTCVLYARISVANNCTNCVRFEGSTALMGRIHCNNE